MCVCVCVCVCVCATRLESIVKQDKAKSGFQVVLKQHEGSWFDNITFGCTEPDQFIKFSFVFSLCPPTDEKS